MTDSAVTAAASGVFAIGRNVAVTRLGFGATRITGPGGWGEPPERQAAIQVLRRAADLGVDFIDTADSYGPFVSEELIREALHPYRGIAVATKGGLVRTGPGRSEPDGRPEHLRQSAEMSLRRLGLDTIELYQLHAVDPRIAVADQIGTLDELRKEGKIRHIGLCGVSVGDISEARLTAPVASVQNPYHLADRRHEAVLEYCEREGLGFLPCSPLGLTGAGRRVHQAGPLAQLARQTGTSTVQLALAWLLRRSPVMLPVPGTRSAAHLEENVAAAELELTDEEFQALSGLAEPGPAG
jgi:aryl-alcohol dehydrogenase-like predicted oxidoreductase